MVRLGARRLAAAAGLKGVLVGRQKRYGQVDIDGYHVPVGARRHDLDRAVQQILDHLGKSGEAGIYSGDGTWRGNLRDPLFASMLIGPDRVRRGVRVDGKDTLLAADPGETFADIQDRLYRTRHYASPRMVTRAIIADAFYVGIGIGVLRPVPRARVEEFVDLVLQLIATGDLPKTLLAYHGQGLRDWLGLPAGEWTPAAVEAAKHGRDLADGAAGQPDSGPADRARGLTGQ